MSARKQKPAYRDGQELFANHRIIGTEVGAGTRVTIVESYPYDGGEVRYLVRTPGRFKVYCYESDLSTAWSE